MILHFLNKKQIVNAVSMMQLHTKRGGPHVVSFFFPKHPIGTRPYLFKKNELKNLYPDWKIVKYEEKLSARFLLKRTNKFVRQHRAVLIVQKPNVLGH